MKPAVTLQRFARLWITALLLIGTGAPLFAQDVTTAANFTDDRQGTDIVGAFADSLKLLMVEHGWRIAFQEKTRRELGGPFWQDYKRSVRMPPQWEDTDAWWVNYIGHPIHGAAAGYIWLDHDPNAPVEISLTRT